MAIKPLSTASQVVVYNEGVTLKDKTAIGNHQGVSIADILALGAVPAQGGSTSSIPGQVDVTAVGTDITTTAELDYKVNKITATSTDYAVKLPEPQLGGIVGVVNNSTEDVYVYPYDADDSIVGLNPGEPYIVPADGQLYNILCVQNPSVGVWSVSTPTSNNSVVRTFTQDVIVSSSNGVTNPDGSKSGEQNLGGIIGPFGGVTMVVPSGTNFIDSIEWSIYNKVRINSVEILTNIPAGDLTTDPSQLSFTLMGISQNEFGGLKAASVTLLYDEVNTVYNQLWNSRPFDPLFSYTVANQGAPQTGLDYYLATSATQPGTNLGQLYQKLVGASAVPNGWGGLGKWNDIKDANGNRKFFTGLNSLAGNSSFPFSGYPAGFEFKLQYIIEFEFSM